MDPNALVALWVALVGAVAGFVGKWHERRAQSKDKAGDRSAEEVQTLLESYRTDRNADRDYIEELVNSNRRLIGENTSLHIEKGRMETAVASLEQQLEEQRTSMEAQLAEQRETIERLSGQVDRQRGDLRRLTRALDRMGIGFEDLLSAVHDLDTGDDLDPDLFDDEPDAE